MNVFYIGLRITYLIIYFFLLMICLNTSKKITTDTQYYLFFMEIILLDEIDMELDYFLGKKKLLTRL